MRKTNLITLLLFLVACADQHRLEQAPEHIPAGMLYIPGGSYVKVQEGAEEELEVDGFLLDKHPVAVASFREFVEATGYVTDAEKFGDAGVFDLERKEWQLVKGASWEYPLGKDKPRAADNHPVTQVSWNDALAYCQWAGKRLPTEAEWEFAATNGGKTATRYSWGNELVEEKRYLSNVWQGNFPEVNSGNDGYFYTAPVGLFGKSGNGLSDMGGNVWQWTSDVYQEAGLGELPDMRVLKSGSFMCDSTLCHNYRINGRTFSSRETALFHTGFRCARDTGAKNGNLTVLTNQPAGRNLQQIILCNDLPLK